MWENLPTHVNPYWKITMNPGDTVKLKGVDRLYTLLEVNTHNEGTQYECKWAVLRPPAPATHTAHWPIGQIELI